MLQESIKHYGPFHIAANGREAVAAVEMALGANQPYDLICLDILMPELSGQDALREIRALERARGISATGRATIIMVSSLADEANITAARDQECDYFLVKPVDRGRLRDALRRLRLIA
jgi:two-component system chemotaxis response regulator CheY